MARIVWLVVGLLFCFSCGDAAEPDAPGDQLVLVTSGTPSSSASDEGPMCASVADCRFDEECVEGTCEPLTYCSARLASLAENEWLSVAWRRCDDGKEYEGVCSWSGGAWQCDCVVNGVAVGEFASSALMSDMDVLRREFNAACGWIMHEPRLQEIEDDGTDGGECVWRCVSNACFCG